MARLLESLLLILRRYGPRRGGAGGGEVVDGGWRKLHVACAPVHVMILIY